MTDETQIELLRQIPAVDQLLMRPGVRSWIKRTSHRFVVSEIQRLFEEIRGSIRSGSQTPQLELDSLERRLDERLQALLRPALRAVINATGVILHTNLGRAPLSAAARDALLSVSSSYANLEYELSSGTRSKRDKLVESMLMEVLGCESSTVVNNNAAAVFLILNTLASGKEVIVSRGELVEIGGSFRIPEILLRSGAILREVGTTNKTRVQDYREAVNPATALLLRVHPSNYRVHGFTQRPGLADLVELRHQCGIPLVEDIGSGCLIDLAPYGIKDEPIARESLAAGVDLICFSCDKLLGGPQAGVIAGASGLVQLIRKNPLMRTYRVDKLVYGALEATLASYRAGRALEEVPVLRLLSMSRETMRARARSFLRKAAKTLPEEAGLTLVEGESVIGGGSCPETALPTTLISLESERHSADTLEARFRAQSPPVIPRVEEGRVLLDLRTVFPAQEGALAEALRQILL